MVEKRNIGLYLVLTIITCGIFDIYWFIVLTDDVKKLSGDEEMPSGGVAFLLSLVTCGIYGFFWAYKMGKTIMVAQEKNNMPTTDNSILYLILNFIGIGSIVNYCLMQNDLNKIVEKNA